LNLTPILLSCLLAAQTPLERLSYRADQSKDSWIIQYQFNQDISPDLKIYITSRVSSYEYIFHHEKMDSILSSENTVSVISNKKCYEKLSWNLLDKRSLSITIIHEHDDFPGIPLSGKRFISIKTGDREFRDVIYLHLGDFH